MRRLDLQPVQRFLRQLHEDLEASREIDHSFLMLSREGQGTLFLDQAERREYYGLLSDLEEYADSRGFSRRAVESYLQDAIFEVLDLPKKSQTGFDGRLKNTASKLRGKLTAAPIDHLCHVRVAGLAPDDLPRRFGRVHFTVFRESQLRRLRQAAQSHRVSGKQKVMRLQTVRDLRQSALWDRPCGAVRVLAGDYGAAVQQSRRVVRDTVDSINFILKDVPYQHGWLYLPEDGDSVNDVVPVLRADLSFTTSRNWRGPMGLVVLPKVLDHPNVRPMVWRIDDLQKRLTPSKLDRLLLAGVQWAGRATRTERREEAFLLLAIALECVMLPEGDTRELSYRLRVRTAHLLGKDPADRKALSKLIGDLYTVRSRIVHNGEYEVTGRELSQMAFVVRRAIRRVLIHRSIRSCGTPEDLAQWFERRVLR
jgi:hypothetical protein